MTPSQILFIVVAAATLGSALMVVSVRNLIHAALWLVVSLFGVAVFYAMLNAGFLAVAQVVIYIGAIAILIIFAIMLTRREGADFGPQLNQNWIFAAILGVVMFAFITWMAFSWNEVSAVAPALAEGVDPLQMLGAALVSPNGYVLPFELASILLLAALVGAIIVAWDRK